MKRSWIKLYLEVLDDEKLAELPDATCWRFVQLLLVAAEREEGGILPPSKRLAWRLRVDQAQLLEDLGALCAIGIIVQVGEHWKVVNFDKRQASMTDAERSSRYRHRLHHESVTERVTDASRGGVTDSSSTSPSDSVSDSEGERVQGEGERTGLRSVIQAYEHDVGVVTPMLAEMLEVDEREYGATWVCAAIQEAVKSEARNLKYVEAILARWKRDGFQSVRKNGSGPSPGKTRQEIIQEVASHG